MRDSFFFRVIWTSVLLSGSLDIRVRWGEATAAIVRGDITNRQHNITNQHHVLGP